MMTLRVCVNTHDQINFDGIIYNLVKEPIIFHNFHEFIVETDKFLDECGHPQSSIDKRSLNDEKAVRNKYTYPVTMIRTFEDIQKECGKTATFNLQIQTRSRGDWQGRIALEDNQYESFSSILELMTKIAKKD